MSDGGYTMKKRAWPILRSFYKASILYYLWLLVLIGKKFWPQIVFWYESGFLVAYFFLPCAQLFLLWLHLAILRGIAKDQPWALMGSLLVAGTHTMCAIALPGLDIYTRYFLIASAAVFLSTLTQFFLRLAELRS